MNTPVGEAWEAYYKPGMSPEEARAFKAGFYSAMALADTVEEPDVNMDPYEWGMDSLWGPQILTVSSNQTEESMLAYVKDWPGRKAYRRLRGSTDDWQEVKP